MPAASNNIFYSPCLPGIIITVCATIVTATIATIFRNYIPLLYTTWPPAVAAAADVIPVVAAFLIFDGTQVRAYWLLGSDCWGGLCCFSTASSSKCCFRG
jgi:hypothetical protein